MGSWNTDNVNDSNAFKDVPAIGALMVSKMVAVDKKKPQFMYREKRIRPEDSGWRIFSGFETQEYSDNPDNIALYSPSTILSIDPSISDLLLMGIGSVFERESDSSEWYSVLDYELEDDYMITTPLTDLWEMTINNLFEREMEESGDLRFTTDDKTVRIAIWNSDQTKTELQEEHQQLITTRDQVISETQEVFDLSDSDYVRIGYSVKEADSRKKYDVIFGFTIVESQVVQLAFYYDDETNKQWAIDTWMTIKKS